MSVFLTPIARIDVPSGGGGISFSNIPQTYADLVVKLSVRSTSNGWDSLGLTINGQFNVMSGTALSGSGAGATTVGRTTYRALGTTPGVNTGANIFSGVDVYITNYTTANFKQISIEAGAENNNATAYLSLNSHLSFVKAPVTTLTFDNSTSGALYTQFSSATLYGVTRGSRHVPKATGGDVITFDGTYYYHAFSTVANNVPFIPNQNLTVDALIIGGGGGGGISGGGGGAGGLLFQSAISLTSATTYNVTVGGGGAGGTGGAVAPAGFGTRGGSSVFSTFTAIGGGGGGRNDTAVPASQNPGGSGGGGGRGCAITGGLGTAGQGNNGGSTFIPCNDYYGGAGGGGAGAVGGSSGSTNTVSGRAGAGGAGVNTYSSWGIATGFGQNISNLAWFAGGGGGGNSDVVVPGGNGGGGNGGYYTGVNVAPTVGLANTGGGGGGSTDVNTSGAAGGSGLVIIRYLA